MDYMIRLAVNLPAGREYLIEESTLRNDFLIQMRYL